MLNCQGGVLGKVIVITCVQIFCHKFECHKTKQSHVK
jgi:hypothetical protein